MIQETAGLANKDIPITISPQILWGGFAIVAIIAIVMSTILLYHWAAYGYKPVKTSAVGTLYFMGAIFLLGIMFLAGAAFTASL